MLISGRVSSRWRCWWLRSLTAQFSCCVQVKRGQPECSRCFLLKTTNCAALQPTCYCFSWLETQLKHFVAPSLESHHWPRPLCIGFSWFAKPPQSHPRSRWRCCSPAGFTLRLRAALEWCICCCWCHWQMGTGAFLRRALCAKTGSLRGDSDRVVYKGGGGGGVGGNANSRRAMNISVHLSCLEHIGSNWTALRTEQFYDKYSWIHRPRARKCAHGRISHFTMTTSHSIVTIITIMASFSHTCSSSTSLRLFVRWDFHVCAHWSWGNLPSVCFSAAWYTWIGMMQRFTVMEAGISQQMTPWQKKIMLKN